MVRGSRIWFPAAAVAGLVALVLAGCHHRLQPRAVPFDPPLARPLAPADDPCGPSAFPPNVAMASPPNGSGPFDTALSDCSPMRRPRNVLALSGGGAYGAYTAGFIDGWSRSGNRPEFDVVTGISTGALIAPFAFLGSEHDAKLVPLYTKVQASDIFKVRAWVSIPFKESIASSAPLKRLIESQINPQLMERLAAEHRRGRRLYVGTTNLDTGRMVVWDMGAIACRPCPEGCHLFRDVLLASCSVPGMFPPVKFDLDVDGRRVTELHADGGVTAQMFVPSHVFAAAAQGAAADGAKPKPAVPGAEADPTPPGGNLYVVVAGKVYPDANPVRARVLPVLGATTKALMYAYCRADLSNLYGMARASGLRYHLASLQVGFRTLEHSVDFDQKEMAKLFQEGQAQGLAGPGWMSGPPTLSPGDGDYIRTGTRLRGATVPVPTEPGP